MDFDVENRSGDMIKCAALVQGVVDGVRGAGLQVSFAPQMARLACGPRSPPPPHTRFLHPSAALSFKHVACVIQTDVYPGWPNMSPGFNGQVPLLDVTHIGGVNFVQVQMYNTWSQVSFGPHDSVQRYPGLIIFGFLVPYHPSLLFCASFTG